MSARALQRVVLRMLFNPHWVESVYAEPEKALAQTGLTALERKWVCAPDKRRWLADSERGLRALQSLLEEYPVAFAQAMSHKGINALQHFFSTPDFYDCLEQGGSMAIGFGRFLKKWDALVSLPAQLESAIAQVRRVPQTRPKAGSLDRWQTHQKVIPLLLPETTLDQWVSQQTWIRNRPGGLVDAVLSPDYVASKFSTDLLPAGVLVTDEDGVTAGECSVELARFLISLQTPMGRTEIGHHLQVLGAESEEADEILSSLVRDGLLLFIPGG